MVKQVFAWVTAMDACAWYRIWTPFAHLPDNRWLTSWGEPGHDIHDYDVVVGQRLAGPNPEWLRLCADPNVLTIYDMDDDLLNIDPENAIPYAIYAPLVEETRRNVEAADVVTVCTPHVAEVMSKINTNVHILPICTTNAMIDLPLLTWHDRLTVGWAGSPYHQQDWHGMPDVLAEYARRIPHARFHMLGADYTGGLLGDRVRVSGLQAMENYIATLDLDIGIAPLLMSSHNRGKSHTKSLEYATRGTPVVATSWGQYADWIDHGVNGLLVHDMREWVDHLVTLSDATLRSKMSTAARESARTYTIDKHIHLWERAYDGR